MFLYVYIYIYVGREREFNIFIENTKMCPPPKKPGSDFVHLFNSFNRHLVTCSCSVHSLNQAENHSGKTHETCTSSFSASPSQPPHQRGLHVLDLKFTSLPASSFPSLCPQLGPSHHCLSLDNAVATLLFSLFLLNPDTLFATTRGIVQKCRSEHIMFLLPIILRINKHVSDLGHNDLATQASCEFP